MLLQEKFCVPTPLTDHMVRIGTIRTRLETGGEFKNGGIKVVATNNVENKEIRAALRETAFVCPARSCLQTRLRQDPAENALRPEILLRNGASRACVPGII